MGRNPFVIPLIKGSQRASDNASRSLGSYQNFIHAYFAIVYEPTP